MTEPTKPDLTAKCKWISFHAETHRLEEHLEMLSREGWTIQTVAQEWDYEITERGRETYPEGYRIIGCRVDVC